MNLKKVSIADKISIRESLERFNELAPEALKQTTLFVLNAKQKLVGVLTEGDIRRAMLNNITLDKSVTVCMNKQFKFFNRSNFNSTYINELKKKKIRFVPFLNKDATILKLIDLELLKAVIPVEVVIMAGGKGERLRPLTSDTPKPMLKVGDKPILEHTIDRLASFGIHQFYLSVNYLKASIEDYFKNGIDKGINIDYIHENQPLGTIGSMSLVKKYHSEYVLLQNADLLTNIDYDAFYNETIQSGAAMSVATIPYHVDVPYAILDLDKKKGVKNLLEKPRLTYQANAGIYLIHHSLLKSIPKKQAFNATDLINTAIQQKLKVASFPIAGYWTDIGRMEDYQKVQLDIQQIQW